MSDLKDTEIPEIIETPPSKKSNFKNRKAKFISVKNFKKTLKTVKAMKMRIKLTYDSFENGLNQSVNDCHDIDVDVAPRKKRKQEHQVEIPCILVIFFINIATINLTYCYYCIY